MTTKGWHPSEATRKKLSLALIGNKRRLGTKHSEETKRKMSIAALGKKKSPEHCANISKGQRGRAAISGDKHYNWKGGIRNIDKTCRDMIEYREWRNNIFERDDWTCKSCGAKGVYVTAHHIKGFSKIIRENKIKTRLDARKCPELWDLDNGITLCEDCHKLTDNYKGRGMVKQ